MSDATVNAPEDPGQANPVPEPAVEPVESSEPWFSSIRDEALRGWAENKGWAGVEEVVRSAKNSEGFHGVPADRLVKLPEDPADMGAVWDRLGRPAEPSAYTVALPDEMKDSVFDSMAAIAHDAGVTDAQFQKMQAGFAETAQSLLNERAETANVDLEAWKGENPQAFSRTKQMFQAIGASDEEVAGAITGDTMSFYNLMAKVSARMGETPLVQGEDNPSFTMSAEAAAAKIAEKRADPDFEKRLMHDDKAVRDRASAELRPLYQIVAAGKETDNPGRVAQLEAENARLKSRDRNNAPHYG